MVYASDLLFLNKKWILRCIDLQAVDADILNSSQPSTMQLYLSCSQLLSGCKHTTKCREIWKASCSSDKFSKSSSSSCWLGVGEKLTATENKASAWHFISDNTKSPDRKSNRRLEFGQGTLRYRAESTSTGLRLVLSYKILNIVAPTIRQYSHHAWCCSEVLWLFPWHCSNPPKLCHWFIF